MPIKIADNLPAKQILESEKVFVMSESRAAHQDIRPLRILILNLMPTKIDTETQLMRQLSNTALQIDVVLLYTATHQQTHTDHRHMAQFYRTFDEIRNEYFDGFIITGAPVEQLRFEDVDYWDELCTILDWSKSHVFSTLHICWGAQAGLYYHYGIAKHSLPEKLFGVFPHRVERKHPILLRGFDDIFMVPHSRHTTILRSEVEQHPELKIAAASEEAGLFALFTEGGRQVFLTGHAEYDPDTLNREYQRDKALGRPISIPKNYFPMDDDTQAPIVSWRGHAHLLFSNWLNYFVYQTTPYDMTR